jgi:hypothetical protein
MQHERAVSVAPGIACPRILFQNNRWNVELFQPRPKRYGSLAASDDDAIGLLFAPQSILFGSLSLQPILVASVDAVRDAERPRASLTLLEAF